MISSKLFNSRVALAGAAVALIGVGSGIYQMLKSRKPAIPLPGWRKRDPEEMDKLLDIGLRDSMGASDPPSVVQPDVRVNQICNGTISRAPLFQSLRRLFSS
jgi:hypothetical protein